MDVFAGRSIATDFFGTRLILPYKNLERSRFIIANWPEMGLHLRA